ncbi:MAG: hypothetical protein EOP49_11790 [Sphingobacteriales bacterium]|nr:MAG: hypothetical protein EOP49_11790 [Sphingobacteriales bacterium]
MDDMLQSKEGRHELPILMTGRNRKTINRIISYFAPREILWVSNRHGDTETWISVQSDHNDQLQISSRKIASSEFDNLPIPDLLLLDLADPGDWEPAYNKYSYRLGADSLVIINGIHLSPMHTEAWSAIYKNGQVKLSLDLYRVGILLYRETFLEKQHFLLKPPVT